MKQSRKLKRTKKMIGGSTNNLSSKNINTARYFFKKKGNLKNTMRKTLNSSSKSRKSRKSRKSGKRTIRPFSELLDSQTVALDTALNTIEGSTNNVSNNASNNSSNNLSRNNSLFNMFYPQTPNSLVENSYRLRNTFKSRNKFDELRDKIKQSDDINDTMFRYGKPTQLVNNFLYSLYNENMICLHKNEENKQENYNMMISVAELGNEPNTLYITISEEPLTPTNKQFYEKMGKLLHMIEIILFKNEYTKKRILNKGRIINNDYIYANGRITILDIDPENISKINDSVPYRTSYRNFRENYKYDETFIPMSKSKLSSKKYNEYRTLIPDNLKIKFVFNTKYINERSKLGKSKSYRPFLKQDSKQPKFIACNSGSICSESKLFSYLHDRELFSQVEGAIAYWVGKGTNFGKECHPGGKTKLGVCNYHPKYSYELNTDTKKDLLDNMIEILKSENKISEELLHKESNHNFKNVFRAFALPCPGCYLNKDAYLNDSRILWNNSKCLEFNLTKRSDNEKLKQAAELHTGK